MATSNQGVGKKETEVIDLSSDSEVSEDSEPETETKRIKLDESKLVTKEDWEIMYTDQLNKFKHEGVMPKSYFGKKLEKEIHETLEGCWFEGNNTEIIDVGCGNGAFLIDIAKTYGHNNSWIGIDYCSSAITLAKELAIQADISQETKFLEMDMLLAKDKLEESRKGEKIFRIVLDVGTYDCISHMENSQPNEVHPKIKYLQNIRQLLEPKSLIIASCNFTREELEKELKGLFEVDDDIGDCPNITAVGGEIVTIVSCNPVK